MSSAGGSVKFKYLHSLDTTFSLILVLVLPVNQHLLTVRIFFRHQGKPGETWQQWILIWGGFFCFFLPFINGYLPFILDISCIQAKHRSGIPNSFPLLLSLTTEIFLIPVCQTTGNFEAGDYFLWYILSAN